MKTKICTPLYFATQTLYTPAQLSPFCATRGKASYLGKGGTRIVDNPKRIIISETVAVPPAMLNAVFANTAR
jgi:hypothetical protein